MGEAQLSGKKDRRLLSIALSVALSISSACFPISFIVGTILLAEVTNIQAYSGLAPALLLISGGVFSFFAGRQRYLTRFGYRGLLSFACIAGIIGGIISFLGGYYRSSIYLVFSFILIGGAHGIIMLSRYAITLVVDKAESGRSLSKVIMWATIGAICGPFFINIGNAIGSMFDYPSNIFPLLIISTLYFVSLLTVRYLINPALFSFKQNNEKPLTMEVLGTFRLFISNSRLGVTIFSMNIGHFMMVFIMAMTPIYMYSHKHSMFEVSLVMSAHFFGMYGFSYVSGLLADKRGTKVTMASGLIILTAVSILSFAWTTSVGIVIGLFLLGVGWNLCFVSGSTRIATEAKNNVGTNIMGFNEVLLYISAFLASTASGIMFSWVETESLMYITALVSIAALVVLLTGYKSSRVVTGM